MDKIDILEKKIRKAADELIRLREDKKKLEAEVSFLQEENKRVQHVLRENETMKDERKTLTGRIEKILKKLNVVSVQ